MIKIVKIVTMTNIVRTKQVKPKHDKDCETKDLLTNGFQCLSNPQLLLPGFLQTWKELFWKMPTHRSWETFLPFLMIILTKEVKEVSPNCSSRCALTQVYLPNIRLYQPPNIFGVVFFKDIKSNIKSRNTIYLNSWRLCFDMPTLVAQMDVGPGPDD